MIKDIFIQGAISTDFMALAIKKHQTKSMIGAHNIFLGQVRADEVENKTVIAIDYEAYKEMANQEAMKIREAAIAKYELTCLHIYHSLGRVKVGGCCLFVFASSPSRKNVFQALSSVVEEIKHNLPIFGKEIFDNTTHQWKENT